MTCRLESMWDEEFKTTMINTYKKPSEPHHNEIIKIPTIEVVQSELRNDDYYNTPRGPGYESKDSMSNSSVRQLIIDKDNFKTVKS